jgi:hypothetical protein
MFYFLDRFFFNIRIVANQDEIIPAILISAIQVVIFSVNIIHLSVLKGDAGNPSLLYKFAPIGLSAHAYRTAVGF